MLVTTSGALRRRWWLIAGLVLTTVVVAVVFVRFVVLRDQARAVPITEVVEDFRAATMTTPTTAGTDATPATTTRVTGATPTIADPTTTTSAPPAPTPATIELGVYRYRTTGSEEIDALDGATHRYPAETTITATEGGCGIHLRWDALRERREEWSLCPTASGVELQPEAVQYHEFFGQPEEEAVACDRGVVLVPSADEPAALGRTQLMCTLGDDPWLPTWEVLERDVRVVAGETVPVRHVRMTVIDHDDYWEDQVIDWYLAETGLPVEATAVKSSRSPSPIGGVVYREEYHLELASLEPTR